MGCNESINPNPNPKFTFILPMNRPKPKDSLFTVVNDKKKEK